MPRRDDVYLGRVVRAVGDSIEHVIGFAVGQRFAITRGVVLNAVRAADLDEVVGAHLGHRLVVDIKHTPDHLDVIARQSDQTFDEIGGRIARQGENDHVAARRRRTKDAPERRQQPPPREREIAVSVGKLFDEQVIADQQRVFHRAGRNVVGLEEEGAQDQGDDQRVNQRLGQFPPGIALRGDSDFRRNDGLWFGDRRHFGAQIHGSFFQRGNRLGCEHLAGRFSWQFGHFGRVIHRDGREPDGTTRVKVDMALTIGCWSVRLK